MINEVLLVENLLKGVGINERCLYQHCYLLAKYFIEQGLEPLEIRYRIFNWATENNFYLDGDVLNVNQIIYRASNDKRRLREDVRVKISQDDLYEIKKRFDSPRTRKVALAILCYAKASSDSDSCFDLSISSFCNWLGYDYSQMTRRYIKELITFKYIAKKKKGTPKKVYSWSSSVKANSPNFQILVKIKNVGEYELQDNNIEALFDECFES